MREQAVTGSWFSIIFDLLYNKVDLRPKREKAMNQVAENDELIARMKEAARRSMTPEEKRAQRISYILSVVGRDDDSTKKEVEDYIDERYGNTHE